MLRYVHQLEANSVCLLFVAELVAYSVQCTAFGGLFRAFSLRKAAAAAEDKFAESTQTKPGQ